MKLTSLLLASSCQSVASSPASLHKKSIFDDPADSQASSSEAADPYQITGFHPLFRSNHNAEGTTKFHPLSQRQISTSVPTFNPTFETADVIAGSSSPVATPSAVPDSALSQVPTFSDGSSFPTYGSTATVGTNKTFAPTPVGTPTVGTSISFSPTPFGTPTVYADKTLYPTPSGTATVGTNKTLSPTDDEYDDGYIYTTEVQQDDDDLPHTPNWGAYEDVSPEQYTQCQVDLVSSDADGDGRLNYQEYLQFLELNSARYGNGSGMNETENSNVTKSLDSYPNEFALIFHSTSCLCAYFGGGEGCCLGDNEGVVIFASQSDGAHTGDGQSSTGNTTEAVETDDLYNGTIANNTNVTRELRTKRYKNAQEIFGIIGQDEMNMRNETYVVLEENVTDSSGTGGSLIIDEEAYTRNFCTDVYNAYKVTKTPTYAPTESEDTEPPSPFPSVAMTPAPSDSTPASSAPIASGETAAPISSGETAAPISSSGSITPTYYPTSTSYPPNSPTSLPPAGGTPSNPPMEIATTPSPSVSSEDTLSPTSPESIAITSAPSSTNDNAHSVFLQYGISSNCGVTADDVLNANENTIIEGLVAATEVLVVNILNSTFPRDEARLREHKIFHGTFAEFYAGKEQEESESQAEMVLTKFFVDNELKMAQEQSSGYLDMAQVPNRVKKMKKQKRQSNSSRKLAYLPKVRSNHERSLVYWSPMYPIEITDVEDVLDQACPAGVNCMKVFTTVKVVLEEGDDAQAVDDAIKNGVEAAFADGTFFEAIPPETIFCPGDTAPPIIGTNSPAIETSAPVSSPGSIEPTAGTSIAGTESPTYGTPAPSVTGAKSNEPTTSNVSSNDPTVAEAVSNAPTASSTDTPETTSSPTAGEAASSNKPSLSSTETAATASPSTGEISSTSAPSVASTNSEITSSPTAGEATSTNPTKEPTSGSSNIPPWALPDGTESPTAAGTGGSEPTPSPSIEAGTTTSAPAASSSSASPSSGGNASGNLLVEVTYDIANDCGVDSQAVMNEIGNTLKAGLIAATTTTTIDILNTTYPRTEERQLRHNSLRHAGDRNLVKLNALHEFSLQHSKQRHLVFYTDEFPVTMDNVIDVTEDCPVGNNCLLIVSTITTVLEEGDDPDEVKRALEDGIKASFTDGSFYANIPPDTVICPEERRKRRLALQRSS